MAHGRARAPERRVAFALGSAKVAFASNAKLGRSGVLLRRLRPAALLARPAHQGRQRGPLGRPPKGDHVTPLLLMAPLSSVLVMGRSPSGRGPDRPGLPAMLASIPAAIAPAGNLALGAIARQSARWLAGLAGTSVSCASLMVSRATQSSVRG